MSYADVAVFLAYFATAGKSLTEPGLRKAVAAVFPEQADDMMAALAERWTQYGWRTGVLDGIKLALDVKFGSGGLCLWREIRQIVDADVLRTVLRALKAAHTPEDIGRVYQGCATWSLVAQRESPNERG